MKEIKLSAQKREITGRKVKQVRAKGLIPANVFGKKIKSLAVSLKKEDFEKVFKEAGETAVVKLLVEGEKEERPILIQNIQRDPLDESTLHVDLRQIILTEKIKAMVPVVISGEAPAVQQKLGILIQTVSEIEVEALPLDLPEHFLVDVTKLNNVGDQIALKDLDFDKKKVEPQIGGETVLARIEPLAAEEKVEAPVAAEAVAEGAVLPAEGEAPAAEGGEAPKPKVEEKKEEKKE